MTENPGGVESFLYNYISEMNPAEFQFDFLCNSYEKVAYEDKLIQRGCKMIHFTARSKNYGKYKQEIQTFFSEFRNISFFSSMRKFSIRFFPVTGFSG